MSAEVQSPILRWAGGKRWLAPSLRDVINPQGRLIEPFVGGAAVFLASRPRTALLSDTNEELINFYKQVRDNCDALARSFANLQIDEHTFRRYASMRPSDPLQRATRFVYLNKTAFGGLWRVNRNGDFNVPFGCRPSTSFPELTQLSALSNRLESAVLATQGFETTLGDATNEDVIYCDPPYTVSHNNNGFLRYNERIFSWEDQRRLASYASRLATSGTTVVVSNAMHSDVLDLYPPGIFARYCVSRNSALSRKAVGRGVRNELLAISREAESKLKCREDWFRV